MTQNRINTVEDCQNMCHQVNNIPKRGFVRSYTKAGRVIIAGAVMRLQRRLSFAGKRGAVFVNVDLIHKLHGMGLSDEKVMLNIDKYGNTTAATIPLCLWDYEKQMKKGDNIVLAAFGGGFTWGATLVKWAYNS